MRLCKIIKDCYKLIFSAIIVTYFAYILQVFIT